MEGLLVLLGLLLLATPILAIVALVKTSRASDSIKHLESKLETLSNVVQHHVEITSKEHRGQPKIKEQPAETTATVMEKVIKEEHAVAPPPILKQPIKPIKDIYTEPAPAAAVLSSPQPEKPQAPRPVKAPRPRKNLEEALGGKVAGMVGVMILVAGIAFLVGSQGISWPSPLFKILMGLGLGGILLACGHIANRNTSGKFIQLARIMTGGGGGLFYFCIFAAYSLYHLCGPFMTALGLTASAALLLFLALVYNSQLVATLGILGAFITPLLVGGDVDQGIFPLAYIALVNLPVMVLGIKKNWQILYNSSYAFTLFYFFFWMFSFNADGWVIPLVATGVYFAEFITLSLLILRKRDRLEPANINIIRIVASSLFLFGSLYWIFYGAGIASWLGLCFAGTVVAFVSISMLSWKWLPEFKGETICFILCGITATGLVILEQTDGTLRGIFWSIQGLAVAVLFVKSRANLIRSSSILASMLGLIYLMILTLQDPLMNTTFFNLETFALLISTILIGVTTTINDRIERNHSSILIWISVALGIVIAAGVDIGKLQGTDTIQWLCATLIFAALGQLARKNKSEYVQEPLYFTLAAIACAIVYLYTQLSGIWIGISWSALGLGIAVLYLKSGANPIRLSSILVSLLGMVYLITRALGDQDQSTAFFNPEIFALLISTALISVSTTIHDWIERNNDSVIIWISAAAGIVIAAGIDIFKLQGTDILPWLTATVLFAGLGQWVRRKKPNYIHEPLNFTLMSIFCFVIYLYMQLNGLYISIAWTALGIGTALFALKTQSKEIQNSGILIGFAALVHATLQPIQIGSDLILVNPHTLCGLFSALSIGFQAKLYERIGHQDKPSFNTRILWITCIGALLIIAYRNIFTALPTEYPMPWLLTSIITLFIGNMVNLMLSNDRSLQRAGQLLIAAIPLKILLFDTCVPLFHSMPPSLASATLWIQVAMLAEILWFSGRLKNQPSKLIGYYSLAPLIVIIAIISLAIGSSEIEWSWAIVSLWWGISALAMTLFGFAHKSKLHRHVALILFAATTLKVLLFDCSAFQAGVRVLIFIGVGILLLILSFIYQKVSERLL